MKRSIALILAIIMTMALVACGGGTTSTGSTSAGATQSTTDITDINKEQQTQVDETKTYKKEVSVAIHDAIIQMDPMLKNGNGVDMAYKMFYNQLVAYNWETKALDPELAESWTVESASSYVFNLRKGVKFSNGEELTADDVVFSFIDRPKAVEGTTATAVWNSIEKIEVINDYSVRFVLNKADADFLYRLYLCNHSIMNREACEKDAENGHMVGTGGWIVDSWSPSDHVTFVRNDESWIWAEEKNPTEKVVLRFVEEDAARAIALQNGEVAAASSIDLADAPALKADEDTEVFTFQAETLYYTFFNMQNGKFTNDVNLRKAVAYGINYQDLIDYETDGLATRAISMWGKNQYGLFEDFEEQYDYNPEKAKDYLAKAGGGFAFDLMTGNEGLGTLIKAQLDALGFTVNVVLADSAGIKAAVNAGTYDMMIYSISLQAIGDRFAFIANVNHSTNRAKYDNPEMMAKFTEALGESDDAKRKEIYKDIQIELHEQIPYLPFYYQIRTVSYCKGVSGILWELDTKADFSNIRWAE